MSEPKVCKTFYFCFECNNDVCEVQLDEQNKKNSDEGSYIIIQKDLTWKCGSCGSIIQVKDIKNE